MTTHLRYTIACAAGALVLSGSALALLLTDSPTWLALCPLYGATVLAWAGRREARLHQRRLAEHDVARRRALGETVPALDPCCLLARTSHGRAHDHRCTRPGPAAHATPVDDPGPLHGGLLCFGELGDILCVRPAGDAHSFHPPYRPVNDRKDDHA